MRSIQNHKQPVVATADVHPETHAAVAGVLKALAKLVHGRKVYATNNPRLAEFQQELGDAFAAVFEREEQLVLTIEDNRILWCEQPVYKSDRREDSLAFLLYKDGIGEITINAEAVGPETDALVEILTSELHNRNSDEDVVTRFWNADFDHISYRVIDDYLGNEASSIREETATAETDDHAELLPSLKDKGRKIARHDDPVESIECYLREVILKACDSADVDDREAYFQSMVESFFIVSSDELEQRNRELQIEKDRDGMADFVETTLVFTLVQDNKTAVRDISVVLDRIAEFAASERNPQTLHQIIEGIRTFRSAHQVLAETEEYLKKLESILTNPEIIRDLCARAESSARESEKILAYLQSVGAPAVNHLLRLLHRAPAGGVRREVCDVLAVLCKDNLDALIERLDLNNPLIAYDVVYIANQGRLATLPAKMRELPFYPDRKVKLDMITILERVADDSAEELLLRMLVDEEKEVRNRAVVACGRVGDVDARVRISGLAFAKDIFERDQDEQDSIFKALGLCGDTETVKRLKEFTARKGLMGFGKNRPNKLLAMRALERIKLPESRALLEQFARDGNEQVKSRAARALAVHARSPETAE